MIQPPTSEDSVTTNDASGGRQFKPSKSLELVGLARQRYRFLISADDGRAYAVSKRGAAVALPLGGGAFRSQLASQYMEEHHPAVAGQTALTDAIAILEADAAKHDPEPVFIRVAHVGERVVLDLGTADGRCVVIKPGRWWRGRRSPVAFRRTRATKDLPNPVRDGVGLTWLHRLLNLDTEQVRLLIGWMIAALIHDIPHPVLKVQGEHGTAKTTLATMVLGLIDPSSAPTRSTPSDATTWTVSASASWTVCLDNVSEIKPWLSDTLCRAVTGEGYVARALYTDDDVIVLSFRRVIVLTTIDAGQLAGDLAERLLVIEPQVISPRQRRHEQQLRAAYERARPAILASLLDLLSQVLAVLPGVRLESMPRMADFARVLAAVDEVTGWDTLQSYLEQAADVSAKVLEEDLFAQAVIKMAGAVEEWTGTATQLLVALDTPDPAPRKWPKNPSQAGGHLRRIAPVLREHGVDVSYDREGNKRTRTLKLRRITPAEQAAKPASALSAHAAELGESADSAAIAGFGPDRRGVRP